MTDFQTYLTDERILAHLYKEMGKCLYASAKRSEQEPVKQLLSLFPPRRTWANLKADKRVKGSGKILLKRLKCIVSRHLEHESDYPYIPRLQRFVRSLQAIAEHPENYAFPKPVVKAVVKKKTADKIVYRPTCAYHDLTAKMLISLMADYLKSWLNPLLHETNMAYRAPRLWDGQEKVLTNNTHAVKLLLQWRAAHDGQEIYIAECDIQKFFDTIDHDEVMDALRIMMERGHREDKSFYTLFEGFIRSFGFREDVLSVQEFDWIDNPPDKPIGIPQGAALSPLIADMLMNVIDEQTLGERMKDGHITDPDLYYVRYCDDMLLAHTDQNVCEQIITTYSRTLAEHHLRPHPFQTVESMKDGVRLARVGNKYPFWDAKSKSPYKWGSGRGNASQWIGFLGYEISRDGEVRLRKSSVAAQAEKIVKRSDKLCFFTPKKKRSKIERYEQEQIGGSTIDSFGDLVTDSSPYLEQRKKLENLKVRKVRRLKERLH